MLLLAVLERVPKAVVANRCNCMDWRTAFVGRRLDWIHQERRNGQGHVNLMLAAELKYIGSLDIKSQSDFMTTQLTLCQLGSMKIPY